MKKLRVAIIFGGRSAEHEVSIQSAKNIYNALDQEKYDPILIGISKKGEWVQFSKKEFKEIASNSYQYLPDKSHKSFNRSLFSNHSFLKLITKEQNENKNIDIVFPVLHGPYGED